MIEQAVIIVREILDMLTTPRCGLCGRPLVGSNESGGACFHQGMCGDICGDCRERIEEQFIDRSASGREGLQRCRICGRPLISEQKLCMRCREREYAFDRHRSAFLYRREVKELIRSYKFTHERVLAGFFADCMYRVLQKEGLCGVPLVPAPPRRKKERRLGWEHVGEIVRLLERIYRVDVFRALERREGKEQKSLDFNGRLENVRGTVTIRKHIWNGTVPERVLLFDDVFTTGATAHECGLVLKRWGVRRVDVVTLAMD